MSVCILGRLPQLGIAELESLYGAEHIRPVEGAVLIDIPAESIDFKRLGGTIKVARILATLPNTSWRQVFAYLKTAIPQHLQSLPEGKFTLGISVYGLTVKLNDLNKSSLELKKLIKGGGRPVRVVPNKNLELNSAQVLHNKLIHRGAWELDLIKDGDQTIIAQTLFIQDIEAYAARDQARPARDARVGMLPPKLAQTIINLTNPATGATILDPFCGTGVILQEALLMGFNTVGSDLEPRMVEYSQKNIDWLRQNASRELPELTLEVADATSHHWTTKFDAVASETYLGRALSQLPAEAELKQIVADTNTIVKKFLANLGPQLQSGSRICLALPAWQLGPNRFLRLPVLDKLTEMGYNYLDLKHVRRDELVYYRADQIVARQLIIAQKV